MVSAQDVPGCHDSGTTSTFEPRFSENFRLRYRTLRMSVFEVTGRKVTGARRLERGKNIRWQIRVRPS